jgi:hypothetical protein
MQQIGAALGKTKFPSQEAISARRPNPSIDTILYALNQSLAECIVFGKGRDCTAARRPISLLLSQISVGDILWITHLPLYVCIY